MLTRALRDARNTVRTMPAFFTTYPNSKTPVFPSESKPVRVRTEVRLHLDFLALFETLTVPRHLWAALSHYACWIEPAILNEWCGLMAQYDRKGGRARSLEEYQKALRWLDEEHDTAVVRRIAGDLIAGGHPVRCLWTGQPLKDVFHVDHCFPFVYWPNNDLWNLMPALPKVNTSKSGRLPTADSLEAARERILEWWERAYTPPAYQERFTSEARASLPMTGRVDAGPSFDSIWTGLQYQRIRLKTDQQLLEWHGIPM